MSSSVDGSYDQHLKRTLKIVENGLRPIHDTNKLGGSISFPDRFFLRGVFVILQGVLGKLVSERGFLMVNLWWDCGDLVVN
jgi:hypothetical protein